MSSSAHPQNGAEIISTHHLNFQSTVSLRKLRRFNYLILLFRIAAFSSSLASFVFMLSTSRSPDPSSPRWYHFDAFRLVVGANAIVAMYSLFEMVASVWEISRGATLFSEVLQVWFDFGHDQVFAYLLLSADSAGTALARVLKGMDTCTEWSAFCIETDISIALGFVGFLFLGFSSVLSGFRVACFVIKGSRFHL
ncbi:CASP-like protein 4C2 [Argentina anserina]|uniref:CASP-like protein 4C2 n=1 Tax=Argentina anserina TaxID=57926 RepID=UPI0021766DC8|nr:CASP-like protein 4C2 [Potentilla anserina]